MKRIALAFALALTACGAPDLDEGGVAKADATAPASRSSKSGSSASATPANGTDDADGDTAGTPSKEDVAAATANGRFASETREDVATMAAGVSIAASRDNAEKKPRVLYSVDLGSDFGAQADKARLLASLQFSYCITPDILADGDNGNVGSPCISLGDRRFSYDVKVVVRLFLADAATDTSKGATPLATSTVTCTHDHHHCPVGIDTNVPIPATTKHRLNAEVIAWTDSTDWQAGDVMEFEGDCFDKSLPAAQQSSYAKCKPILGGGPDPRHPGLVAGSKGQISVFRADPTIPASANVASSFPLTTDVPLAINDGTTVVRSIRVDGVMPGDVLEAEGEPHVVGDGYNHNASGWWVLAASATTTRPAKSAGERFASAVNSQNCQGPQGGLSTNSDGVCTIPKQGAVAVPAGAPSTMFLNFVVELEDQHLGKDASATADGKTHPGKFAVTCSPASSRATPCSFALAK